jgi:hypothetical protein
MSDLGPLIEQAQAWWTAEHEPCTPPPPAWGEPAWGQENMFAPIIRPFCGISCGWKGDRDRDQLVASLCPHLKAVAVEAAQLLEQPDAQVGLQVASALVPTPYGEELTIVADLIEAAGAQTVKARNKALLGVGATVFVLVCLFLFSRE